MVDAFIVGAPGVGVRSTGTTVTGTYSQPPKAGNLLVAVIKAGSTTSQSTAFSQAAGTTGWSSRAVSGNAATFFSRVEVWSKVAAGADAAPSFNVFAAGTQASHVTIYEIFNPNSVPIDVSGTAGSGSSSGSIASATIAASTSAAVAGSGEIGIYGYAGLIPLTGATNSWTRGSGFSASYNDASTSSQIHMADEFALAPASGAVLTDSPTITTFTGYAASLIVVIKQGTATYPQGQISLSGRMFSGNSSGATTVGAAGAGILNVGSLLVLGVKITSSTLSVSSVSDSASANITTGWTRVAGPFSDTNATVRRQEIWIGKSTGTGPTTLTITWSASNSGLATDYQLLEFTTGYTWSTWSRDGTQQAGQNNATSTTHNWTTLTSAAAGDLFVGTCRAGAGPYSSTLANTGCLLDSNGNPVLYNLSAPSGSVSEFVNDAVTAVSYTLGVLLDYVNVWPLAGSGDSTPSMTSSGTISLFAALAGSGAAVATGNGALTSTLAVAGSAPAVSTANGTIYATLVTAGSATASSVANGVLGLKALVAGSSAASSVANGTVVLILAVSGIASTVSSASADVRRFTPVAGSSVASSTASGTLSLNAVVVGSAAAVSSASGAVTRVTPVAGSSAAVSSGSGAVTISTGAVTYAVNGSGAAVSSASGTAVLLMAVAGSGSAVSSASGTIGLKGILSGSSAASSSASGAAVLLMALSGSSVTASVANGSLSRVNPVTGSGAAVSSASGALSIVTGPVSLPVNGTAASSSLASGSLSMTGALAGSSVTAATASGAVSLRGAVSGAATAIVAASGTLYVAGAVSGSAVSLSSAAGWLGLVAEVSGLSVTVSGADGAILPPFIPGALPDKITAIVVVEPGASVLVSVDSVPALSGVTVNRINAEVS